MQTKTHIIIVAGGNGNRLKSNLPKQFLQINNKPIIAYTIEQFKKANPNFNFIIVCNANYLDLCKNICNTFFTNLNIKIIAGGKTRFHSVLNGLNQIDLQNKNEIVAIHDAVRPFVKPALINFLIAETAEKQNAITSTNVTNTIYQTNQKNEIVALNRANLKAVQTPQCFNLKILKDAYEFALKSKAKDFTDDASVWQFAKNKINLSKGDEKNIKITFEKDLVLAKQFLKEE